MDSSLFELGVVITLRDYASNKIDEINNKWDAMKLKLGETNAEVLKMEGAINNLKVGGALIGAGLAVGSLTMSFVNARMETSKLEGNLKSLGLTSTEVDNITKSAYSMSSGMGESTDTILTGIYDLKSAVSDLNGTELVDFTQSVLDATIATKGNFEGMSKLFGMTFHQFKHLYSDMDNVEFGKNIANDIAWAANVYRADGQTIEQAMKSVGSTAASLKISLEEESAVLGMLLNTMDPGVAGTAWKSYLTHLNDGFGKLGLNAYNANGKLKNTSEQLAELRKKFGNSLDIREMDIIKKAYGSDEAVQFINTLLPKTDELGDKIHEIVELSKNKDYHYLDIAKQANLESLPTQMKRASEGWENFQKIIGKGIEDSGLKKVVSLFADGLVVVNDFLKENQKLAEFAGTFLMLSTTVLIGVGAFLVLKGAWTAFSVAMNVGLISNPFGWIVLGVVGAVVGIALLITYWKEIKDVAVNALTEISGKWKQFTEFFRTGGADTNIWLNHVWSQIISIGPLLLNKIQNIWKSILDSAKGFGRDLLKTIGDGITWSINFIIDPLKSVLEKVARFLPHSNADEGPLSNLTGSGAAFVDTFALGMTQRKASLGSVLTEVTSGFETGWGTMKNSGIKLVETFATGIKSNVGKAYDTVIEMAEKIRRPFPNSDAKEGPLSTLTKSGRATVTAFASGIETETPRLKPVMQRFNEALAPEKGIIRRLKEESNDEDGGVFSGKKGSNITIGSLIGQMVVGGGRENKRQIGEILADALFDELDRYEEVLA
ncbi:tail tape measure protein, TIGR01760 family [Leptospira santarosai str. CBC1531]|uniref:phage tail tape measure protein n=1 Tax=Leptospira santarosai TaxID=28183 RepID=UPI0002BFC1E7|nr:phage tail tape measure protein [Leptospira santarosai]EMP80068.1 tail tape measure protein, TIGR01760 family [Leptospira santarosai str. CBC1531]